MSLYFAILVFIIATLGLIGLVQHCSWLPMAFCPAVALCAQILALYLFALLGILRIGVSALTLAGMAAFLWMAAGHRELFRQFLSPAFVFFLAYGCLFAVVGRQTVPLGFDNFTHWCLIVKDLYLTDALPVPGTLVTFTNYPPATALYEYFVLQFLGFSESHMLLALNLFVGSLLACCLVDVTWRGWKDMGLRLIVIAALVLIIPESWRNLTVDAVLGYLLLSLGMIALWDRCLFRGSVVAQGILCAVLVLTKMSGAILVVIHGAFLLVLTRRIRPILAAVIPPVAVSIAFSLHLKVTFADAVANNQFQVSTSGFVDALQGKSPAFWSVFPEKFLRSFADRTIVSSVFFMACTISVVILLGLTQSSRAHWKRFRLAGVFSFAAVLFYSVCLAGMYVFMMSEEESMIVASFYRYFGTIVIYLVGMPCVSLLWDMKTQDSGETGVVWRAVLSCVLCGCLLLPVKTALEPYSDWQQTRRDYQTRLERTILGAAEQLSPYLDGNTIPVYTAVDTAQVTPDFTYYFLRYGLFRTHIWPLSPEFWQDAYFTGEGQECYLLWLDASRWTETAFQDLEMELPDQPGLYWKDRGNQLTLLTPITKASG